jgi:hypothetical protein
VASPLSIGQSQSPQRAPFELRTNDKRSEGREVGFANQIESPREVQDAILDNRWTPKTSQLILLNKSGWCLG